MKNLYARVVLWMIRPALVSRDTEVAARGNDVLKAAAREEPEYQMFFLNDFNPEGRRPFWHDGRPW
jgi:hypothetical protein